MENKENYWFLIDPESTKNWVGSSGYDGNQGYYATIGEWARMEASEPPGEIWVPFPEDIVKRSQNEMELINMSRSFWKRLKFLFTLKIN